MTILVCRCGRRIKAPGARPGRVGKCPSCGRRLEISPPEAEAQDEAVVSPAPPDPIEDGSSDSSGGGYALQPSSRAQSDLRAFDSAASLHPNRAPVGQATASREARGQTLTDGFLPALDRVETGLWSVMCFPLRSAEATCFIAVMAVAFWLLTVLVPEYCLTLWDDANLLGTPSMGMLIILISAIPGVLLLPFVLVYLLQYLGRVLVSSARGDTLPPRTPERNFESFTAGLSPWIEWLVLGIPASCLPLGVAWSMSATSGLRVAIAAVGMIVFGFPYAYLSLMLSFLHERSMAATPFRVLGTLARHGVSLAPTVFRTVIVMGLTGAIVAGCLALRSSFFWLYLLSAPGAWMSVIWALLVVARLLGLHYYRHQVTLGWNPQQGRWGVRWRH